METLRTAVVGPGKVAHTLAAALRDLPESEFVGVCSRDLDRASAFAAHYNARPYTDVAAMVRDERVDVVVICTPHPAHAMPAIAAIEAGAHVLVEKPLAASLADCDAVIEAAERGHVMLGVISQRRWYQPVRRMKQAIDGGKIGRPVLGMVTMLGWRDEAYYQSDPWRGSWEAEGGGVLVNQAAHQLDLLLWYMGPIAELTGYWENFTHPTIEVEDTAVAVIRFCNGGLGSIVVSNSQRPGLYGKVHVHGESGASVGVQTDGGAMFIAGLTRVLEPPVNDLWTVPGEEMMLATWRAEDESVFGAIDPSTYFHRQQVRDFLAAVGEGRSPAVSGYNGRSVVELFTGIYRSQRDRRPVSFPLSPERDRNDLDGRRVDRGR